MKTRRENLDNLFHRWINKTANDHLKKLTSKFAQGFTLTELIIAAFLASIVLGVSGWGVVSVLGASKTHTSQSTRRMEMQRSLSFIANEIQQATKVNETNTAFSPSLANNEIDPTSLDVVLRLTIPGLAEPITYYIATPRYQNRPWIGPKVVYRWGPLMDAEGKYLANWAHLPLIDSIEDSQAPFDTVTSSSCPENPASPGVPATRWDASPQNVPATGFFACVDPSKRIAQIFYRGRIFKAFGATDSYLVQEQAFARAATVGGGTTASIIVPVATGRTQVPQRSQVTLKVLGSDIRCGAGGIPMKTRLVINVAQPNGTQQSQTYTLDPNTIYDLTPPVIEAGGSISYTGQIPAKLDNNFNNVCNADNISNGVGFNSDSDPKQVRILKQGDPIPNVAGFGRSLSAKAVLTSYIRNNAINLPDPQHQAIILFELGTRDPSSSAFDLQDIVVLAISNPVP